MRIPRSLLVAVAALAIGAAACGSTKSSTAATTVATTVATTPTTQAPTTTAVPATTTTIDATAAMTEITAAFTKFFNGADPDVAGKLALLQNGDNAALKALFIKGSANPAAALTYVKVTKIALQATSDCSDNGYTLPCALVNYDLYVKPATTAALMEKGYAVLDGSVWKISRTAYCVLSNLGGNPCPPA